MVLRAPRCLRRVMVNSTPVRRRRNHLAVLAAVAWVAASAVVAIATPAGASPHGTEAAARSAAAARGAAGTATARVTAAQTTRETAFLYIAQAKQIRALQAAAQSRAATATGMLSWTVRSGQTLTGISGSWCGTAADWPGLYDANKAVIGSDPDLIKPGQQYSRGCYQAAVPHRHASYAPKVTYGCGDGDGDGYDVSCASIGRGGPATATVTATGQESGAAASQASNSSAGGGTYQGSSGMQSCIIARESGGNPRAVNPSSGAGGLFQFLPSTWAALGHSGLPENASVAEQVQAFDQEVAQSGYSAWTPYDGC